MKRAARENFGLAGHAFVECFVRDYDAAVKDAEELRDKFRSSLTVLQFGGVDGQVHRATDRFALVYAAGALACSFGILPCSQDHVLKAVRDVWEAWIAQRGGVGPLEDKAALDAVRSFISTQPHRFGFSFEEQEIDRDHTPNRAGIKIHKGGQAIYAILPSVWKDEVCKGLSAVRVAQVLRDKGFLKTDNDGKLQSKIMVDRGRVRCYCVRSTILDYEPGVAGDFDFAHLD